MKTPKTGAPEFYTCDDCGVSFEVDWTDEEAREEAVTRFGPDVFSTPVAKVCDGCYEKYK